MCASVHQWLSASDEVSWCKCCVGLWAAERDSGDQEASVAQIILETYSVFCVYSVLVPQFVNFSFLPGKPHRKRRGIQDQFPAETHRNQSKQEPHHTLTSHPGGTVLQYTSGALLFMTKTISGIIFL